MKKLIWMLILPVFLTGPVLAQDEDGTEPASRPAIQAGEERKSVREMTPEERREFWDNLSEADKQRVLERRRQIREGNMRRHSRARAQEAPAEDGGEGDVAPWDNDPTLSEEQKASLARGKAHWDALSDDEKRDFLMQHREAVEAGGVQYGDE